MFLNQDINLSPRAAIRQINRMGLKEMSIVIENFEGMGINETPSGKRFLSKVYSLANSKLKNQIRQSRNSHCHALLV
jgi:hypothetical protein